MPRGETAQEVQGIAALADLYDDYFDKIARYIATHIGNRDDAEDLAGEVFLRALKSVASFKERGIPMGAWLFRIAHNLMVDHLRKWSKRKRVPLDEALTVADNSDPGEEAIQNIQFAEVQQAMVHLSPAQQEVVALRFAGGLSSAEVAQVMGRSNGAVRELQHAALKSLRRLLASDIKQDARRT